MEVLGPSCGRHQGHRIGTEASLDVNLGSNPVWLCPVNADEVVGPHGGRWRWIGWTNQRAPRVMG